MKNNKQYPSRESDLLDMIDRDVEKLKNVLPMDLKYLSDPMFMMKALHVNGDAIKYAAPKIRFNRKFRALSRLEKRSQTIELKMVQLQREMRECHWPPIKVRYEDYPRLKALQRGLFLDIHKLREEIRNENGVEAQ